MNNKIKDILSKLNLRKGFQPQIIPVVDIPVFFREIGDFFNIPLNEIEEQFDIYKRFSDSKEYSLLFGELKTLSTEEAFLLFLAAKKCQPRNFCEIGTQYGKSTRRILDIFQLIKLNPVCYCYDISKDIRYVSDEEVEFNIHDLTVDFRIEVLNKISPELIYLDAHPNFLLKTIINDFIIWSCSYPSILAIHDCSSGLFQPIMQIPKDKPSLVTSRTGLWERHVLAEVFHVADDELDDLRTTTHQLKIFHTPHGLALIVPLNIFETSEVKR
jgi:hypothetical protein